MADLDQLALALANIVQNALEATESRQEGRVALEIDHAPDNMVALRVFDNGEGICEEIRPHIWRSFFSTKRKLGLGLSIAKQVIDKLQGQIECVPSHLGGAGIQILLPSPAGRK
jgi:signal transduction histidine kinase